MKASVFQKCRLESALTLAEFLVLVCILAVLAFVLGGAHHGGPELKKGQMLHVLSKMRQLHLAAQTMALDGTTTGDTNLCWPGDGDGSYSSLAKNLVPAYLSTNDFARLLSAAGRELENGRIPRTTDAAVLFYAVREKDASNTVFLTTANFTNTLEGGAPPVPGSVPFGTNGFVVFRKGGDGAILPIKDAGDKKRLGGYTPLCR